MPYKLEIQLLSPICFLAMNDSCWDLSQCCFGRMGRAIDCHTFSFGCWVIMDAYKDIQALKLKRMDCFALWYQVRILKVKWEWSRSRYENKIYYWKMELMKLTKREWVNCRRNKNCSCGSLLLHTVKTYN